MRLAVRVETQARGKEQEICIGAEHGPGGTGAGDFAADSAIKTFHAIRLREVFLRCAANTAQRVEIARQPAIILGVELVKECGRVGWGRTCQFRPSRLRLRAAGYRSLA